MIEAEIEKLLSEFKLDTLRDSIVFVSDRGSNIVKALNDYYSINCAAHLLNNLVGEMYTAKTMERFIKIVSHLVRYFTVTGLNSELVKTLIKILYSNSVEHSFYHVRLNSGKSGTYSGSTN